MTLITFKFYLLNLVCIFYYFDTPGFISATHLSQYLSRIIAPSVLYVTNFVAGSPQPIQNFIFLLGSDVKGSILFSVFSNNNLFTY